MVSFLYHLSYYKNRTLIMNDIEKIVLRRLETIEHKIDALSGNIEDRLVPLENFKANCVGVFKVLVFLVPIAAIGIPLTMGK